mgnify:CR=1 FL=1
MTCNCNASWSSLESKIFRVMNEIKGTKTPLRSSLHLDSIKSGIGQDIMVALDKSKLLKSTSVVNPTEPMAEFRPFGIEVTVKEIAQDCLLYTSPSPRD